MVSHMKLPQITLIQPLRAFALASPTFKNLNLYFEVFYQIYGGE